ncbi:MAG: glycosyltransferase [Candidatus Eremiobacteraeota bacterium]|nr:glycosyltransferase [Candidatus Eremiobacteraeota bacterium]
MRATLQLCTYNRAHLLGRVLDGCFEQTAPPGSYEVVLVNDGSTDDTAAVIGRARSQARVPFTVIEQPNSGLAKGRNAGIAKAAGERIIFIDDDVLPTPVFVAEHLRSHELHPAAIVRGAAINTESFDDLPPPVWSLKDYSGNYFWTTNVSVPLAKLRAVGGFNESFAEYGWEDIDVGLRLRFAGVKAVFNKLALAFHYKPRPRSNAVDSMIRQARAQARTAIQLEKLHPHWRTYLATGNTYPQRVLHKWIDGVNAMRHYRPNFADNPEDRPLSGRELRAARGLAASAYYRELETTIAARDR